MVIEIDGSRYSGSGTIVRLAVVLSAITGRPLRVTNVRAARRPPGLRAQHTRVVEAVRSLVQGRAEGNDVGSRQLVFEPGPPAAGAAFSWDIGSAGSTVLLGLALLPLLAYWPNSTTVILQGGVFQDFAPTVYHLQHVMLPLLEKMGLRARVGLVRPGYVPAGQGIIELSVEPVAGTLRAFSLPAPGPVQRLWGISIASHLDERRVAERMATAANQELQKRGLRAEFETISDTSSVQPGAALAAFADLGGGVVLGADRAGAPRRSAEAIGRYVAAHLLEDIESGASLDRHAADQVILFAALADGVTEVTIPSLTGHVEAAAWLVREFLGAEVAVSGHQMRIHGAGLRRGMLNLPPAAERSPVAGA